MADPVQGRTSAATQHSTQQAESPQPGRLRKMWRAAKSFISRVVHGITDPIRRLIGRQHKDNLPDQKPVGTRQSRVIPEPSVSKTDSFSSSDSTEYSRTQETLRSGSSFSDTSSVSDEEETEAPEHSEMALVPRRTDAEPPQSKLSDTDQSEPKTKAKGRWKKGFSIPWFKKKPAQEQPVSDTTTDSQTKAKADKGKNKTKTKPDFRAYEQQKTPEETQGRPGRVGSFFRSVFSMTKTMSFMRRNPEPEPVDPLDSDETLVGKAVKSGLVSREQAGQMREKYSEEVVDVLLKTPYLQEQVILGNKLSESDLKMIDLMAARLNGLRVIAHRPESVLQRQADAMLGRTLDLGDAAQLSPVLTKYIDYLGKSIQPDFAKKALLKLLLQQVKDKIKEAEHKPGSKTYSDLFRALKQVKQLVPQERTRQTVAMLQNRVRENALTIVKREFKEQLKQQLAGLNEAGASRSVELNLDLELDGGLFGVNLLGGNIGLKYEFQAEAGDDGKIRDQHGTSVSLGLTIGNDVIKGKAAVGGGAGIERTFNNLDDFVEFHSNDLLTALLTRKPGNTRRARRVRQLDELKRRNLAENEQLVQRLVEVGAIAGGDRIGAEAARKPKFLEAKLLKVDASIGASMLDDMVSGEYQIENTLTRYKKRIEFMDALKERPDLVDDIAPKSFSLVWDGKTLDGEAGHAQLDNLKGQLETHAGRYAKAQGPNKQLVHQQQLVLRHQLKQAMSLLYAEYDHYGAVVNRYEGRFKGGNKAEIRKIKHRLESARGANGRGTYLKSLIATHCKLDQLYRMTFNEDETPVTHDAAFMTLLDSMETDYRQPRMNMTMGNLRELSAKQKAKSKSTVQTGTFTFKIPKTKYEISAEVSYEKTKGHPNPDFDGTSASVSFTLTGGAMLSAALKAFKGNPPGMSAMGFAKNEEWLSLGENVLPDLGLDFSSDVQVVFNMGKGEKGWRLENLRIMAGDRLGLNSPTVSIPAGSWGELKLQAGASLSSVDKLYERIGDDTAGYIQTRYNGWKLQNEVDGDTSRWAEFKMQHEAQLRGLLKNIGKEGSNARLEIKEIISDLKKVDELGGKKPMKQLRDHLYKLAENEQYDEAMEVFEQILDLQYKHLYVPEARSRFGKVKA